jgi:hypothetical protein
MKFSRIILSALLAGILPLLSGCLYDNPPSGPSQNIDTWLVGRWDAADKSGREYRAVVAPSSPSHYRITLSRGGGVTGEYDAWISRVDGFSILVAKALGGESAGKHLLFHYELLAPATPPPGDIGATRIRLAELQLDPSARTLDSYHLRRDIRDALKAGTLLAPYDVETVRKQEAGDTAAVALTADHANPGVKARTTTQTDVPGSVIWTKTGGVTLSGETF